MCLVSDVHCERLSSLGDLASREGLDIRTTGSNSVVWQDVTSDYNDEDNEGFSAVLYLKNEVSNIGAANSCQYDSAKLWTMWKGVTSKYREAFANFTKAGKHKPFEVFHGWRMDVYYLHLLATINRPNPHKFVFTYCPTLSPPT